jgi:hypothetical protein
MDNLFNDLGVGTKKWGAALTLIFDALFVLFNPKRKK